MSALPGSFDSIHLALFSGKGGVGKTTLACGFARDWAKRFPSERVLLLSTDPAHSLGDVLQVPVSDTPTVLPDLANLTVRALDAQALLQEFKTRHGDVLELLVERGSFAEAEDLGPVWNLIWPGLDELMSLLEMQRLLRDQQVDRLVVDMAPSGHTLNLLGLMDFLDNFLGALELFQEKHRVISRTFGKYQPDGADTFLQTMHTDLADGRRLFQDVSHTACLVVANAEQMSLLETERLLTALAGLKIPCGGIFVNRVLFDAQDRDRYSEQQALLSKFADLHERVLLVPQQAQEPLGGAALDRTTATIQKQVPLPAPGVLKAVCWPLRVAPGLGDFVTAGQRLIVVGGKGGVGKSTVAASIAWAMAERHPDCQIRAISIDPAHSLGDAFGTRLQHEPSALTANLSAQEIDAQVVLNQFRNDYLWELADMMSGEDGNEDLSLAYGPEAWRKIVEQALPGLDEMLSLVAIMDCLNQNEQNLVILDTAPTGHLLRFLEMPLALEEWLGWIFKLWVKYQDMLGRVDFMSRLRRLRREVVQTHKQLKDSRYTQFVSVFQARSAILAETVRLMDTLAQMGIAQDYAVWNRFLPDNEIDPGLFVGRKIVRLPELPRSVEPLERIQGAAGLLFDPVSVTV